MERPTFSTLTGWDLDHPYFEAAFAAYHNDDTEDINFDEWWELNGHRWEDE